MRRRLAGYLVRLALSAAVLAVLASRVEWASVATAVGAMDTGWALVALGLLVLATLVRVWSFMLVTNHRGSLVGFAQAAYLTLVGSAAALVLPGGSGELFKAHVGGRSLDEPEHLTVTSLVDKLTSLAAVAAMGTAGALAAGMPWFALGSGALCVAATLLVFVPRLVPWKLLTRITAPGAEARAERIESAHRVPTGLLAGVLAVSLAGWAVSYLMIFAVARAFSVEVSVGYVFAIAPLVTISTLLPLSVAGVGISQLTLVALLTRAGIDGQAAAQVALGQLALSLLPPLAGLALYAAIGDRAWRRESQARSVTVLTTVFPRFEGDPSGSFVAAAARALAAEGWDVTAVAPHAPGLETSEVAGGVRVERFRYLPGRAERLAYGAHGIPGALRERRANLLALPFFACGLARAARRAARRSAVLHAHWAPVGAIAAMATHRAPVVLTLHGTDVALAGRGGIWLGALRLACRRSALVLPVSERLAEEVRALVPDLPAEKVRVIGNGVDPTLLQRTVPDSQRDGIVFVGRLTEEKGAFDAVRALVGVPGEARLTLIGGGDPAPVLALASGLGLAVRVSAPGPRTHDEALDAIAHAAAFVLPSHAEGFSVATLEAAALGTPVVASDVGAIADILGSADSLHVPGDVAALSALLARTLEDRAWAARRAASARSLVAERFTWPAIADALAAAYDDAVEVGRS